MTSVTLWGKVQPISAQPLELQTIEILAYFKEKNKDCLFLYGHCLCPYFPVQKRPIVQCRFYNEKNQSHFIEIPGKFEYHPPLGNHKYFQVRL